MRTVRAPQDSYTWRNFNPGAPHRFVHFRPYISKNAGALPLGVLVGVTSGEVFSVGVQNGVMTMLARMPEAPEINDALLWDGIRWRVQEIRNGKVVAVFHSYEERPE